MWKASYKKWALHSLPPQVPWLFEAKPGLPLETRSSSAACVLTPRSWLCQPGKHPQAPSSPSKGSQSSRAQTQLTESHKWCSIWGTSPQEVTGKSQSAQQAVKGDFRHKICPSTQCLKHCWHTQPLPQGKSISSAQGLSHFRSSFLLVLSSQPQAHRGCSRWSHVSLFLKPLVQLKVIFIRLKCHREPRFLRQACHKDCRMPCLRQELGIAISGSENQRNHRMVWATMDLKD